MRKNIFTILFVLCVLPALAQLKKNEPLNIIDLRSQVKKGYRKASNRAIDIVVIHSTYQVSADSFSVLGVMRQFKSYGVSAHYIIGRNGEIYYTVDEQHVAFHAGQSMLPGTNRTNLNTNSVGIEIINTPSSAPTDAQYESLVLLVLELKKRHPIKYVVRHSDIAPGRKTDPWMFQWEVFQNFIQ